MKTISVQKLNASCRIWPARNVRRRC